MRPFSYRRASTVAEACKTVGDASKPATTASVQFLAGGTNLIDLMKLDVMHPATVIDLNDLQQEYGDIRYDGNTLRLGAFARMSTVAEHPLVIREFPVIAQSLRLAASQQLRVMATLGGNVLQRTRCNYFRDISYRECNKRQPGSGCAALQGVNRKLAVLGVSDSCIAHYPGDFAQALVALGARVQIANQRGSRELDFNDLHLLPGSTPHVETVLAAGEIITGFSVPGGPWARRSLYLKIRDRESYEFALASAAVALQLRNDTVDAARIGLGGVATKPWRAQEAEASLVGKRLDEVSARRAAQLAFASAVTHGGNDFKPELGRRTLIRALLECAALEV
jgi:xanthine dehydrogenase YagS FAD-binding subunit